MTKNRKGAHDPFGSSPRETPAERRSKVSVAVTRSLLTAVALGASTVGCAHNTENSEAAGDQQEAQQDEEMAPITGAGAEVAAFPPDLARNKLETLETAFNPVGGGIHKLWSQLDPILGRIIKKLRACDLRTIKEAEDRESFPHFVDFVEQAKRNLSQHIISLRASTTFSWQLIVNNEDYDWELRVNPKWVKPKDKYNFIGQRASAKKMAQELYAIVHIETEEIEVYLKKINEMERTKTCPDISVPEYKKYQAEYNKVLQHNSSIASRGLDLLCSLTNEVKVPEAMAKVKACYRK